MQGMSIGEQDTLTLDGSTKPIVIKGGCINLFQLKCPQLISLLYEKLWFSNFLMCVKDDVGIGS